MRRVIRLMEAMRSQASDETMGFGSFDDLDGEAVEMRDGGFQLLSGITAIVKDPGKRGIRIPAALDEVRCAIAILDIGGVDQGVEQVAGRVGRDVALAPFDLLARVIAARPAGFGGFSPTGCR